MNYAAYKIELSDKDEKIVKANPNATVGQLMEKGLSPQGVDAVLAFEKNIKPFSGNKTALQPKSVSPKKVSSGNGTTTIFNKRTQNHVTMSATAAARLLKSNSEPRMMGQNYGQTYHNA